MRCRKVRSRIRMHFLTEPREPTTMVIGLTFEVRNALTFEVRKNFQIFRGRWARPHDDASMRHCMPTVAHLNKKEGVAMTSEKPRVAGELLRRYRSGEHGWGAKWWED